MLLCRLLYSIVLALMTLPTGLGTETSTSSCCSSLEQARDLNAPLPSSTTRGEHEGSDFWANHSSLLKEAWQQWESQQQDLAPLNLQDLIHQDVHDAVQAAWGDPSRKEDEVKGLWTEVAPQVYQCQLLNATTISKIRQYLDQASSSGIPMRRPNGMNRYGMILSTDTDGSVCLKQFDAFLEHLINEYVRPMGRMLFHEYVSRENDDDVETYAFTIRYKQGQDVQLKEHSDASLYTLNINLNTPSEQYSGSALYFVDDNNNNKHNVSLQPGMAVLHRGMTRHAATPIDEGERINLVIWFFGRYGDVRIAPYEPRERLCQAERWSQVPVWNKKEPIKGDLDEL